MGYSFKEEDGYSTSSCYPQTFNTEFDRADNNEGITVLDITNVDKIRHCFVNIHSKSDRRAWGMIKDSGVPSMIPLSATEYMKAYGHEQEHFEEAWKEWIHHLSKLDLIDSCTLNSVWPRNIWQLRVGAEIVLLSESGQGLSFHTTCNVCKVLIHIRANQRRLASFYSAIDITQSLHGKVLEGYFQLPNEGAACQV